MSKKICLYIRLSFVNLTFADPWHSNNQVTIPEVTNDGCSCSDNIRISNFLIGNKRCSNPDQIQISNCDTAA